MTREAKPSINAAKASISRDAKSTTDDSAERTQGALSDRYVAHNTPNSLYPNPDPDDYPGDSPVV